MSLAEGEAKLAYMANQIARYFEAQPEDAAAATEDHLRKFWTPAMRSRIVERANALDLSPVARAAVTRLAQAQPAK
ncbi:MAG TPA: formate dehydrogenase subunit delta [Caulobacteraceae bacterium]|nr:formate dehydrogenase subunit delta [Caulobacteraceae bacterium]